MGSRSQSAVAIGAGALLASAVAGCGSSPDAGPAQSSPDFEGPYVAEGPGDIARIEFHAHAYTLTPTGCSTASCLDVGTYSIDSSLGTCTLESSTTGTQRTLPLVILETEPLTASAPDFVNVDVNGLEPRGDLVKGGQTVTQPQGSRLITAEEIVRALLGPQKLTSDPSTTPNQGTAGTNAPTPGK